MTETRCIHNHHGRVQVLENLSTGYLSNEEVQDAVKYALAHLEYQDIEWWAILAVMRDISDSRGHHHLADMLSTIANKLWLEKKYAENSPEISPQA